MSKRKSLFISELAAEHHPIRAQKARAEMEAYTKTNNDADERIEIMERVMLSTVSECSFDKITCPECSGESWRTTSQGCFTCKGSGTIKILRDR